MYEIYFIFLDYTDFKNDYSDQVILWLRRLVIWITPILKMITPIFWLGLRRDAMHRVSRVQVKYLPPVNKILDVKILKR